MPSSQEIAAEIVDRHRFKGTDDGTIATYDTIGLVEEISVALSNAKTPEGQRNHYDRKDRVKQEAMLRAFPIKVAAYRVRDPETDEWSPLQFHMTYDDCVMGVMSEGAAKLFATFVRQTVGDEPRPGESERLALKDPA